MRIERWCICFPLPDRRPAVSLYAAAITNTRELGGALITLAEFADSEKLEQAQEDPAVAVFGSLSMPASRVSQNLMTWLGNWGLVYQPAQGDTVLNLLRAIRSQLLVTGNRIRIDEQR